MVLQCSCSAGSYSERSCTVSHPCGTHSISKNIAMNMQWAKSPAPHGDTFPWRGPSSEPCGGWAPCTLACNVNSCAYYHQWDVKLDVPHQMQSHCVLWNSNAHWWEQWENVNIYTWHPAIYKSDKQNNCYIFKEGLINIYSWYHCANHLHGYTMIPATFQTSLSDLLLPLNMCFGLTNLKPTEVALSLVLL